MEHEFTPMNELRTAMKECWNDNLIKWETPALAELRQAGADNY
jgi:hypothetical protein